MIVRCVCCSESASGIATYLRRLCARMLGIVELGDTTLIRLFYIEMRNKSMQSDAGHTLREAKSWVAIDVEDGEVP